MTDIPKLTAEQAACLRLASFIHDDARFEELCDECDKNSLTFWRGSEAEGPCLTDLGRKALAAYDAERERAIRAEAIAECLDWVRAHASCEGIAEKIARDIEENVKP